MTLWSDHPGSGLASLTKRNLDLLGMDFDIQERVSITTLDTWCEKNHTWPDALKIDVEGMELAVLHGAERALTTVKVLQFEFGGTQIDQRLYFADYFRFFHDRGFDIYRVAPRRLLPIPNYSELDETFQTTNYLALAPQENQGPS
jgi:hypothetical protein